MSPEKDRITSAVTGALLVGVAVALLLGLLGACDEQEADDGFPCAGLALVAVEKTSRPKPAAPAAPTSRAPVLRKDTPTRPPAAVDPGPALPAPTATPSKTKKPRHHVDIDGDPCD
ncbi:hypothetical protein [Streptomyces sp. NPDC057250]|uniref:hypothetical protein n=1 Tax=Streptomyces sp. NPDC057250 TaxID=3346068 RepID=UPI00362800BD